MAGKISKTRGKKPNNVRQPRNIPHLASRLFDQPLLIDERKLDAIIPIFERKMTGEPIDQNLSADDYRENGGYTVDIENGIAVIPVMGTLIRRSSWLDAWSGLQSYGEIQENVDAALNDARVKGILLHIDSCGGESPGCFELCDYIFNSRPAKPIWAHADVDAMSAAYAIGCSAERLLAAPRGHVASIGVVSVHLERSRQNDMAGLTYTVFRAGERKADFNPYEKLPPEAAQKQLASMDRTRNTFVQLVSRNRSGVSVQAALDTEGQWYDPEDGLELGLIDGIATFEQAFTQFAETLAVPPALVEPPKQPEAPIEPEEIEPAEDDRAAQTGAVDGTAETGLTGNLTSEETIMDPKDNTGGASGGNGGTPPKPENAGAGATVVDFTQPENRANEIASLCKMSGFPGSAPDFILSSMTVPEVRERLTNMQAQRSEGAVSGDLNNQQPGKNGGAGGVGNGFTLGAVRMSHSEAVASWQPHLKAAQASNPRFAPQRQLPPQ
jgi:capsid assembly protease